MGKFEYVLVGVMAFLVLGILGMIAVSPDNVVIDLKEETNMETSTPPKSTVSVSIGGEPLDPDVTIGESLQVKIKETESLLEPEIMNEPEPAIMEDVIRTHEIIIPEGAGVPGVKKIMNVMYHL